MTETSELLLRKALDAADRRRKATIALTVAFAVLACFVMIAMNQVTDLRLMLIAGFTGLAFLIAAIGLANIGISYRNTAAVLKAIALMRDKE